MLEQESYRCCEAHQRDHQRHEMGQIRWVCPDLLSDLYAMEEEMVALATGPITYAFAKKFHKEINEQRCTGNRVEKNESHLHSSNLSVSGFFSVRRIIE